MGQRSPVTMTLAALQLKLPLLATMPAMCRAWKSTSSSLHGPGTTRTGVTAPSSLEIGLSTRRSPLRLRRACSSGSPPNTIASCVRSEPVMWMVSTSSWCTRWLPMSAPPRTT